MGELKFNQMFNDWIKNPELFTEYYNLMHEVYVIRTLNKEHGFNCNSEHMINMVLQLKIPLRKRGSLNVTDKKRFDELYVDKPRLSEPLPVTSKINSWTAPNGSIFLLDHVLNYASIWGDVHPYVHYAALNDTLPQGWKEALTLALDQFSYNKKHLFKNKEFVFDRPVPRTQLKPSIQYKVEDILGDQLGIVDTEEEGIILYFKRYSYLPDKYKKKEIALPYVKPINNSTDHITQQGSVLSEGITII